MKDLTKLTLEEANKIEMVLLMQQQNIQETIEAYEKLSNVKDLPDHTKGTMRNNAEWWKEAYKLIYGEEYITKLQVSSLYGEFIEE